MKYPALLLPALFLLPVVAVNAAELKTDHDRRSYALGANVGKNIRQQELKVDPALVSQGLLDELAGKSQLSDAELGAIMQQVQGEVRMKMMARYEKDSVDNKRRGAAFLEENKKKDGVKVLPGGVQYKVITAGTGRKPTINDTIQCNYRGMLVDGKVFDASQPGKPASFKVSQVIPGWQEALTEMPVGSRWQLVIPAEKAYGERGAGNAIGPNETLIFEVELVGIQ
ncbi:MAG: FKBP-type peptidyl-prolyl cis-trans isomerase [Deltaproteobacteria bacterium]|nr:MAG: FKBP-type peptidyl-prolyl cis-trans isomerase [Deltaproteobacteria bacterium]